MLTPGHAKGVSLHNNCSTDYIHNTGARIYSLDLWTDASCCYTLCLKLRKRASKWNGICEYLVRSSHSDVASMNEMVCCSVSHIAFRIVAENSHVINHNAIQGKTSSGMRNLRFSQRVVEGSCLMGCYSTMFSEDFHTFRSAAVYSKCYRPLHLRKRVE